MNSAPRHRDGRRSSPAGPARGAGPFGRRRRSRSAGAHQDAQEQGAQERGGSRPGGPSAVVVGGGLAGMAAALELADHGVRVTLVEGRPRLGGLAFSFRRGELWVDNGQHVFLRCCTAYRGFLDRIGATGLTTLQSRLDVPVLDVAGASPDTGTTAGMRLGRLRRSVVPVPLHLAASLLRYPHLTPGERLRAGRAAWALRRLDPRDPALDARDFAGWLAEHGQSERAVEALWDLVGVATLNARAKDVSLALAAMVFRTGLLSEPGAADIGWAAVPLGHIHHDTASAALRRAGVRILLRSRAARVERRPGGWSVALEHPADGAPPQLTADAVVLAVPHTDAGRLLPEGALDQPGLLRRIGTSPILNVHAVWDRPVLRRPFFAALGSPVQWVFDRTAASGLTGDGQYLAVSQSAADDEIDLPTAELRTRYLPELQRLLPTARSAKLLDFFITRERSATFAPAPGVGTLRPGPCTRAPGVYLAGAWTDTGWPATMEGAVRSGRSAAREALSRLAPRAPLPGTGPPGPGRSHEGTPGRAAPARAPSDGGAGSA